MRDALKKKGLSFTIRQIVHFKVDLLSSVSNGGIHCILFTILSKLSNPFIVFSKYDRVVFFFLGLHQGWRWLLLFVSQARTGSFFAHARDSWRLRKGKRV